MASPGNHHCANCIGTLSFPIGTINAISQDYDMYLAVGLPTPEYN